MSNSQIADWKKAAIVSMGCKYGDRAIARRLDINYKTVKKYRELAEEDGQLQMNGINMEAQV